MAKLKANKPTADVLMNSMRAMGYSFEAAIAEIRYIDFLSDKESGTIVLWENFDLIEKSSGNVYAELGKHQNATADYLSLIFHRYLNGEGRNPLTIRVNNYKLTGLDPFLENHRKTNVRRKVEIPIGNFEVVKYGLLKRKHMTVTPTLLVVELC